MGNNSKTKIETDRLTLDQENGRTESDAIHHRMRSDKHSKILVICQSCNQKFESTSLLEVHEHYAEIVHGDKYLTKCRYCEGKVHEYYELDNNRMVLYHDCWRSKRGDHK